MPVLKLSAEANYWNRCDASLMFKCQTTVGQELRAKAVKPCNREVTFPLRLLETDQQLLQVADRPIDATVPQMPLHGRDVPVNGKQYIGTVRVGAAEVIGDLLHRLDLHGDVEPVDDVSCRLRHRPGPALEDFGAVRDQVDVAETAIPRACKVRSRIAVWSMLLVAK